MIGLGEVGNALREVLAPAHDVDGYDAKDDRELIRKYDVFHVCFPPSEKFVEQVHRYEEMWLNDGGLVVVHSSVPVGTTDAIGPHAVHSPIRGVHPRLADGIRTFVKFCGGPRAAEAAAIFTECGVVTSAVPSARTTEALKLLDTTYYGWCIAFEKLAHEFCAQLGADFDVAYASGNQTYNEGYRKLGRDEVVRPMLRHMDGPIGGHCVVPNARIIAAMGGRVAEDLAFPVLSLDERLSRGVDS